MEFPGVSRKQQVEFPGGVPKKKLGYVEFPGVLVFGFGISKGCNSILHNFQGWSFDLSGISTDEVNKGKPPGRFQKIMSSTSLFVFFWNSPLYLKF